MLTAIILLAGGLALLVLGADRFVAGASGTARNLGVPPLVIGLTIVGVATSMPEVLVGSVAAWDGKTTIAIGNALGSNIANIGLVLGATALLAPLPVQSRAMRREFLGMILAMLGAFLVMLDQELGRLDGLLLLVALALIMGWIVKPALREAPTAPPRDAEKPRPGTARSLVLMLIGLPVLLLGAELLVRGAVDIARTLGVSELVIGLTVVAVGTSLPELAASLASVIKNEVDIAIGNVVGSNMFNMLMVLGVPPLIHPARFAEEVLWRDFSVMAGLSLAMGWMIFHAGKNRLSRWEGALLLVGFVGYQYWLFRG